MLPTVLHRNPAPRFEDLTETTGIPLSPEGADMLYTRYDFAAAIAHGKRVLELGCAAGQGFGLLERVGAQLVGGDYSMALLRSARMHYGDRAPLAQLSADNLPFRGQSFDLVLCFEASYYVPDMERAFDEIARVLAPGGSVLFVNANPDRTDFIRSPHSVHYHSASEFRSALKTRGFAIEVFGAFPATAESTRMTGKLAGGVLLLLRRVLEAAGLIPKTLRGRANLKRLLYTSLIPVPPELFKDFANAAELVPLANGRQPGYKVIYVRGVGAA